MKHASFQMTSYRQTLSAIYEYIVLLERHRLQESPFRSEYYEVPPLTLHAFGASGWQTKSGYVGVTYYFYNREQEKWITYTQSRPMFYEGATQLLKSSMKSKFHGKLQGKDTNCLVHLSG